MVAVVRLARLPSDISSQPELLARYWDEAMSAIEKSLNAIIAIPEIQTALAGVNQAVSNANSAAAAAAKAASDASAQAAANTAQAQAQAKEASLVNSYVANYTGALISSTTAGVVTVADHDRVYGDSSLNPTVHVKGGTINTGASPDSVVRIYYNDLDRTGGMVSYQFTVDPANAPVQSGNTHSVGAVTVPETGTSTGKGVKQPGFVDP